MKKTILFGVFFIINNCFAMNSDSVQEIRTDREWVALAMQRSAQAMRTVEIVTRIRGMQYPYDMRYYYFTRDEAKSFLFKLIHDPAYSAWYVVQLSIENPVLYSSLHTRKSSEDSKKEIIREMSCQQALDEVITFYASV